MPDEFYGDETLLTSHKTPSFSSFAMSAKVMVFNVIKLCMKLPLRLAQERLAEGFSNREKYIFIPKVNIANV